MTVREHADVLFALLSEKLGQGLLALNEAGNAFFSLGDTIFIAALDEEAEILLVSGLIGQLPTGPSRERCLRELAQANFNWGGTDGGVIGLERSTGLIYLHRRFFLPLQDPEDFPRSFAVQLSRTRHWADILNQDETPLNLATAIRV